MNPMAGEQHNEQQQSSSSVKDSNLGISGLIKELYIPFKRGYIKKSGDDSWKSNYKIPGVYMIRNISNEKCYIGSTTCLYSRLTYHINSLAIGTNESEYLQNAYNKHGKDNFEFLIMERFPHIKNENKEFKMNYVRSYEQLYLDKYFKDKLCYNIRPNAFSAIGCSLTSKAKERIKNSRINTPHRRKIVYQFDILKNPIRSWRSGAEAARTTKFTQGKINHAARNNDHYNGYYWSHLQNPVFRVSTRPWNSPIYCLDILGNETIFKGIKECSDRLGINISTLRNGISEQTIVNTRYRFSLVPIKEKYSKCFRDKKTPVRSVVGFKGSRVIAFPSVTEAAKYFKVHTGSIVGCIKKSCRCKGFQIEYSDGR